MTVFNLSAQLQHPKAPALYQDCYCYDDAEHGVFAEPLIHQTTATLQKLISAQPQRIRLSFSKHQQPDWQGTIVRLDYVEGDPDGSDYAVTPVDAPDAKPLPAWLCKHLEDFFDVPPATFYCCISS